MNFFLFMVHYFGTEKVVHSCSLLQFWCISINARFCIFLFINEACFKTISSNIPLCFLGVHNLEYNCITISNLQIFFFIHSNFFTDFQFSKIKTKITQGQFLFFRNITSLTDQVGSSLSLKGRVGRYSMEKYLFIFSKNILNQLNLFLKSLIIL